MQVVPDKNSELQLFPQASTGFDHQDLGQDNIKYIYSQSIIVWFDHERIFLKQVVDPAWFVDTCLYSIL